MAATLRQLRHGDRGPSGGNIVESAGEREGGRVSSPKASEIPSILAVGRT